MTACIDRRPSDDNLRRFAAEYEPGPIKNSDDVKQLAATFRAMYPDERCTVEGLIAMSKNRDPFKLEQARQDKAEWFARLVADAPENASGHLRRLHYWAGSVGYQTWRGDTYLLSESFGEMSDAKTAAEAMGIVNLAEMEDRRNEKALTRLVELMHRGEPELVRVDDETHRYRVYGPGQIHKPTTYSPTPKPPSVDGYGYHPGDEAVMLYVIVEKSSVDDLLEPICDELGVTLVTLKGFSSTTVARRILKRGGNRPIRIAYISDLDQGGNDMPRQIARWAEHLRASGEIDRDVAVHRLALTWDQADHYDLPLADCDPDDKRRWNRDGRIELDALATFHPDALGDMLRQWATPYRDGELRHDLDEAVSYAGRLVNEAWKEHQEPVRRRVEAFRRLTNFVARRHADLFASAEDFNRDAAALNQMATRIQDESRQLERSFSVDLPDRPEPDVLDDGDEVDGWLMNSNRNYLEQLVAYRDHDQATVTLGGRS